MRKLVATSRLAFRRVRPKPEVLKAEGVDAGARVPAGSVSTHIPTIGCALLWLGAPDSSSAVTSAELVLRAAAAVRDFQAGEIEEALHRAIVRAEAVEALPQKVGVSVHGIPRIPTEQETRCR